MISLEGGGFGLCDKATETRQGALLRLPPPSPTRPRGLAEVAS